MRTILQSERFHDLKGPLVLAAGFFDGVHRGHLAVLQGAIRRARELGGEAWALTFDKHPKAILAPDRTPPLLTSLPVRLELLQDAGLDGTYLLTFRPEMAARSPEDFVHDLCKGNHAVAEIHCGANWRFGAKAAGTPERLAALGDEEGFHVIVEDDIDYKGAPISSTRIRKAIQAGELEDATAMLGRCHRIRETVVHGREVARTFGIATANFNPTAETLPPVGVYAVRSRIGDRTLNGIGSLGWRPTFREARPESPVLEVHFIDFDGDLYGATLDIAFHAKIRDERRFESGDALFGQIRKDIETAKAIFAGIDS